MPIKLTSAETRVIGIAALVAAVSLAVGIKYFARAFPEASIEFRVNRDDSTPIAEKFLSERAFRVDGYRHAAVFDFDDSAKVYLERTQGLERMDRLTRGPIHLWRWSHRWFKPQQKEEFRVDVSPAGAVVGLDHEIPEEASGASLESPAARAIAEKFLTEVMKRDLNDLEFVETESEKRPARTDHSFTWKQKSVDLGDGSLRVSVEVDGDQVAGYHEFVKVPEMWSRDYEKLRSRNVAAQLVDQVFWILLTAAGAIVLILRLRDRDVPIRLSVAFALIATALYFLSSLNTFSVELFNYRTTDSYSSFVSSYLGTSLLIALGAGAWIFFLVASGEPVYREGYPHAVSFRRYLSWRGLRTRSFFLANIIGITLTFFFFAYQTGFYLLANKLGAWAPADVKYSDLLRTHFPWVFVLFMGFLPAVSEEMQFRAFAIPFLRKYLRSSPVAIVLAAFIWGFLHSGYPNQPFFIRGVEVGVGGVIVGIMMLRFGILATLIWHYSVDAFYGAVLLLRSSNPYLMISGGVAAGIMLLPLVAALVAYLRTGTFAEESSFTNASEGVSRPPREAAPEPVTRVAYRPLSRERVMLAAALIVVFVGLVFIPVYRFGKGVALRISRSDALRAGDDYMRQLQANPATYRRVAWVEENIDSLAVKYLLEHKSVEETDHIYRQATRLVLWRVRYFRPLEKEEYLIFVDPTDARVFGYQHSLDENAPGATLTPEQAQALASKAVEQYGYRLSDFELQNSQAEKKKARTDYTLTWQAKPGDPRNVAEARYRLLVEVAGDQVVGFARSFHLPEQWERERRASHFVNAALKGLGLAVYVIVVTIGLILLVRQIRAGAIPWRRALPVGVAVALILMLSELNDLPVFDRNYQTTFPLGIFRIILAVSIIVFPLLVGLACWLLAGLVSSLHPDVWSLFRSSARARWRRDAILALAASVTGSFALSRVGVWFLGRFHVYAPVNIDLVASSFNAFSPGAEAFLGSLLWCVFYALIAAMVIDTVRLGWAQRAWWFWLGAALVLVSLGPSSAHSLPEYMVGWATGFLALVCAVALVFLFFRNNVLAYVAAVFGLQVSRALVALFSKPSPFLHQNGFLLIILTAFALGWMFLTGTPAEGEAQPIAESSSSVSH